MSVIIINPNSTASMTHAMVEAARATAPDLSFEGWTSQKGPPAIQGEEDGRAAAPHLLELVLEANGQNADGIIIGCFDDTALREAADLSKAPVIGIGQAAYHLAALRNWKFSVVTTLSVSIPIIENNITEMGLMGYVGKVRASEVPVLELETNPKAAEQAIVAEAICAEREDGVDAIVLGCAGMVHVTRSVSDALGLAVIDPVAAAASGMRWLL